MRWGSFVLYVQNLYLVNVKIKIAASIHVCSLFLYTLNICLLHCYYVMNAGVNFVA